MPHGKLLRQEQWGVTRDVNFICLVDNIRDRYGGEDFSFTSNGYGKFKYLFVNGTGAGIIIIVLVNIQYKIFKLPFYIYKSPNSSISSQFLSPFSAAPPFGLSTHSSSLRTLLLLSVERAWEFVLSPSYHKTNKNIWGTHILRRNM